MFSIKSRIKYFINKAFYDNILSVESPRECKMTYKDVGTRIEAYIVTVQYKYAGERNYYFAIDNDHLHLVSQKKALAKATDFYMRTQQKMQLKNENTK